MYVCTDAFPDELARRNDEAMIYSESLQLANHHYKADVTQSSRPRLCYQNR